MSTNQISISIFLDQIRARFHFFFDFSHIFSTRISSGVAISYRKPTFATPGSHPSLWEYSKTQHSQHRPLLAPPNPRCPRTILDQHGSNMAPILDHVGPTWVQHGPHVWPRDHCGPGSPRDHCGPGPHPNQKWNFFQGLYP